MCLPLIGYLIDLFCCKVTTESLYYIMSKKLPGADDVRYEVITQEDPETGDIILPIPEPVLKSMGLKEGDEIEIDVGPNGEILLKKASK